MPEGVNAKVEALFAHSLSAFAVVHLRITSLQGEVELFSHKFRSKVLRLLGSSVCNTAEVNEPRTAASADPAAERLSQRKKYQRLSEALFVCQGQGHGLRDSGHDCGGLEGQHSEADPGSCSLWQRPLC